MYSEVLAILNKSSMPLLTGVTWLKMDSNVGLFRRRWWVLYKRCGSFVISWLTGGRSCSYLFYAVGQCWYCALSCQVFSVGRRFDDGANFVIWLSFGDEGRLMTPVTCHHGDALGQTPRTVTQHGIWSTVVLVWTPNTATSSDCHSKHVISMDVTSRLSFLEKLSLVWGVNWMFCRILMNVML
jgi:hypothetical protein